ncbi:hypothetical protein PN499_14805 [Kamptonema animale CS-326]|uniref:hypothetical protein n=1 Tax=Kamptonema animale TaxID=92934 RepID=UPI00232E2BD8|nr:hypothetical protein [Kamptonema animale]MDB9512459.1 hypothetical protein [Kamptonema animale CS-326]
MLDLKVELRDGGDRARSQCELDLDKIGNNRFGFLHQSAVFEDNLELSILEGTTKIICVILFHSYVF